MQLLSDRQCAAFIHRYDHPDNIYKKKEIFLQNIKSNRLEQLRKGIAEFIIERKNNDILVCLTLSD